MNTERTRRALIVFAHAVVGWALCFATIGIGMKVASQQTALVVHAVAAPSYFFGLTLVYYRWFAYTRPLQTALAFTGIVMFLDFFLVALVILRSLVMFTSPLGTWIPFALIFLSTWLTGAWVTRREPAATRQPA